MRVQPAFRVHWNNSKSFGGHSGANEEIAFLTVPIVVVYKNKKVGDTNSQQPLIIDISDKDFGSLWFPLVKKSNFQFSVTCKHVHEMKTDSVLGQFLVNGEIFVSGHYQLIGSYSTGKATSIVVEKVLDGIYNEVRKNMN